MAATASPLTGTPSPLPRYSSRKAVGEGLDTVAVLSAKFLLPSFRVLLLRNTAAVMLSQPNTLRAR